MSDSIYNEAAVDAFFAGLVTIYAIGMQEERDGIVVDEEGEECENCLMLVNECCCVRRNHSVESYAHRSGFGQGAQISVD